jgi:acetoin utilization deacetylase AcuC-like enzyme
MSFRSIGRTLTGLILRRPATLWYDPRYRLPLGGMEAPRGLEPRRADFAAWWLTGTRIISPRMVRAPQRIAVHRLARVHTPELLESLGTAEGLAAVFSADPASLPVDELFDSIRLACGGTLGATRETLENRRPSINLLGGFHHAAPSVAGGFCPVNDIAVAIVAVRDAGFAGRIAVIDLDAHPPDGLAACLGRDPKVYIGSLSGSDWGPLPAVDETLLPPGTGDTAYLEALRALLDRIPRPDLAFVIAGGDVLAGDKLGQLGLTLRGARRRDLRVVRWLEGIPQVWLPGGGYTHDAWRVLAGTGMAVAARSLRAIPDDYDPLGARFAGISADLSLAELGDASEITAEDVEESLGLRASRQRLLLGFYTASGLELALHRLGIFLQLTRLGYRDFRVVFDREGPGERLRLLGTASDLPGEQLLVELILERRRCLGVPVLYIHWLSLRHPRARFTELRPPLPGQEVPGLGLAHEAGTMLARMAVRLGLGGVAFRPSHYHLAYSVGQGFTFVQPDRQGRFEALRRDLADIPLAKATALVAEGRVLLDGRPYTWEADEMVYWLREHPFDAGEVERVKAVTHFTVAPPAGP